MRRDFDGGTTRDTKTRGTKIETAGRVNFWDEGSKLLTTAFVSASVARAVERGNAGIKRRGAPPGRLSFPGRRRLYARVTARARRCARFDARRPDKYFPVRHQPGRLFPLLSLAFFLFSLFFRPCLCKTRLIAHELANCSGFWELLRSLLR